MKDSIVRDGNHFIRMDAQWTLIDGEWFDMLKNVNQRTWITAKPPEIHFSSLQDGDLPKSFEMETQRWEQIRWSNGHPYGRKFLYRYVSRLGYWMMDYLLGKRVHIGFICDGGKLPERL